MFIESVVARSVLPSIPSLVDRRRGTRFMGGPVVLVALLCLLGGCQNAPPPTTATTTTTTTTTTAPAPSGDATAYLQGLLDKNKSLSVGREYVVNGTLKPPAGADITFTGSGLFRRTTAAAPTLPVIQLEQGGNTLRAVRIVGPNPCYWTYFDTGYRYSQYDPTREWNHGISILGGSGYLIDDPSITAVWGDAIYLGRGPRNVTITNLQASCVGRSIVSNTGSENVRIDGGAAHGAFWWTFNIQPFGTNVVRNYRVNNFRVGWSRMHYIFSGQPDFNCQVYDVAFTNISFTSEWRGVSIDDCVRSQITY